MYDFDFDGVVRIVRAMEQAIELKLIERVERLELGGNTAGIRVDQRQRGLCLSDKNVRVKNVKG